MPEWFNFQFSRLNHTIYSYVGSNSIENEISPVGVAVESSIPIAKVSPELTVYVCVKS